jgi:hypothetical protein
MLSTPDRPLIQPHLLPGERLHWTGRPQRGLVPRRSDLLLVPLGVLAAWLGYTSLFSRDDALSKVRDVLVLILGCQIIVGRLLREVWLRRRLVYAVTDRRVLMLRTGKRAKLRSLEIGHLPVFEYLEHPNGRGTLLFDLDDEEGQPLSRSGGGDILPILQRMRFDRIEQPRLVYEIIRSETDRWREARYGEGARSVLG